MTWSSPGPSRWPWRTTEWPASGRPGANIAKAAADPESYKYLGDPGVCANCHSRLMYLAEDGKTVECSVCGIKGELVIEDGKLKFAYPPEQLEHAHNLLPGKIKHVRGHRQERGRLRRGQADRRVQAAGRGLQGLHPAGQAGEVGELSWPTSPNSGRCGASSCRTSAPTTTGRTIWRWLYKQHVPESISQFMPYCTKYCTYHALPLPEGALDFGTYNGMMTEHYWLFNIFQSKGTGMPAGLAFGEEYPEDFMEMTCQPPSKVLRQSGWQGSRDGYHPVVFSFAPSSGRTTSRATGRLTDDGPNFRWLFLLKYPDGVSIDEGDAWFKEVFAPEVCAQPGGDPLHLQPAAGRPAHQPVPAHRRDLVRRLRGVAQGLRREGRAVHQAGLGDAGTSSPSSSPSRTSWASSSSTGPTPTTCSSGGATSPPAERRRAASEARHD